MRRFLPLRLVAAAAIAAASAGCGGAGNSSPNMEKEPVSMSNTNTPEEAYDLDSYLWKNRVLLLFAGDRNSEAWKRQMQEWYGWNGREEAPDDRDLVFLHIFYHGNGDGIPLETMRRFYEEFDVDPGEEVLILIGKDGGEKLREPMPVDPFRVTSLIDTMPMRKREMQERKTGGS